MPFYFCRVSGTPSKLFFFFRLHISPLRFLFLCLFLSQNTRNTKKELPFSPPCLTCLSLSLSLASANRGANAVSAILIGGRWATGAANNPNEGHRPAQKPNPASLYLLNLIHIFSPVFWKRGTVERGWIYAQKLGLPTVNNLRNQLLNVFLNIAFPQIASTVIGGNQPQNKKMHVWLPSRTSSKGV